jgi:hypothetical protein
VLGAVVLRSDDALSERLPTVEALVAGGATDDRKRSAWMTEVGRSRTFSSNVAARRHLPRMAAVVAPWPCDEPSPTARPASRSIDAPVSEHPADTETTAVWSSDRPTATATLSDAIIGIDPGATHAAHVAEIGSRRVPDVSPPKAWV